MLKSTTAAIADKVFGQRVEPTGMRPLKSDVAANLANDLGAIATDTDGKTYFNKRLTNKQMSISVYAVAVPDKADKVDIYIDCVVRRSDGIVESVVYSSCKNLANIIFAILLDYEGYKKKREEEKKAIETELLKIEPKLPEDVVRKITGYLGGKRRTRKGNKLRRTRKSKKSRRGRK